MTGLPRWWPAIPLAVWAYGLLMVNPLALLFVGPIVFLCVVVLADDGSDNRG